MISDWLTNFQTRDEISETESQKSSSEPLKRKKFHDKISKFFYQFKSDLQIYDTPQDYEKVEDLENRADEWNYLGEKVFIPAINKVNEFFSCFS